MAAPCEVGQVLVGKYRVERVLGEGGMGVVVAARHLQLEESVAIKFLLPDMLNSPEVVERFARESRAAIKIKSEHVVRVMDVGQLENGAPYMVMEYLNGRDLSEILTDVGALPVVDAVSYVLQACEAVADAHVIGIVHRDLKPANLFLTQRNDNTACVKVLDFGISKVTGPGSSSGMSMTRTTAVMGSPLYMSPEQMASSRDVDMRADIWSMGAVLYELLAGHPPFEGETLPQVCTMILQSQPPPLKQFRPDVPDGLEHVILKCLEKDKNKRWQNIAEFAIALAEYAPRSARTSAERIARVLTSAGLSQSALQLPPSSMSPTPRSPTVAGQTAGSWEKSATNGKSSSAMPLVIGGLAVVALVGIVGVVFLVKGRGGPASTPVVASEVMPAGIPTTAPSTTAANSPSATPSASAVAPPEASAASTPTTVKGGGNPGGKKPPPGPGPGPGKPPTKGGGGLDLFNDNK